MRVKDYIKHLLSIENYSFSLEEVIGNTNSVRASLKFELARQVEKKEIVSLRKGFHLIIPPRYSKQGHLPIQLYIDKLFKSLNRNYYLAFYSAAKFHGASHQQSQREYVITERPKLNDIKKVKLDIKFMTSSKWPTKNIVERKSDAGIFKISSPALTAVDLIHHQTKLGGLNRMLSILEELSEEITDNDLKDLLSWYPHRSTLQRFGFIMEELQLGIELDPLFDYLISGNFFPVLLSPKGKQKPGSVDNRWKVDVNIKLESDL
ncbi:type IV toxin-antitoxin system AbiEi family antitoxin [Algoriphagus sp. Y33]|uniref:type IV toxin-antitoxin system AbiEi family antitoxin domain-containing protein n=1 Tax=Algoriphagus sp. Y33 TaxID=2772483 RepID=UPI00177CDCDD|nr:type IV toxin-antitoxin system AbiEi family antitoxin [Algoriphagus sp. Y33]